MTDAELAAWLAESGLSTTDAADALRSNAATWRHLARAGRDADAAREAGRYLARADRVARLSSY